MKLKYILILFIILSNYVYSQRDSSLVKYIRKTVSVEEIKEDIKKQLDYYKPGSIIQLYLPIKGEYYPNPKYEPYQYEYLMYYSINMEVDKFINLVESFNCKLIQWFPEKEYGLFRINWEKKKNGW